MLLRCFLLVLALASTAFGLFGHMKNVTVRGNLMCGREFFQRAKVELWEDDRFNFDDLLNTTNSDEMGGFSIYGQTREVRNIEPYLLITHNCDDGGTFNVHCSYIDRYDIPRESAGKTYQMREVNLELPTKKRKKKCHD